MSIRSISRLVFQRTREFFKDTARSKSGNKRYRNVNSAKTLRRHVGQQAAQPWIDWARANAMPGRTLRHYGLWLYRQGVLAAGNCAEMSCVALYYFSVAQTQNAVPWFPVNYIELQATGDHAFLIAGYLPPVVADLPYSELSTVTLEMLCNAVPEVAESYVVDVWSGIFCPTWEYPSALRQKMLVWSGGGKEVRVDHEWFDPAPEDPDEPQYADWLLNSPFYIGDPAEPLPEGSDSDD